MGPKAFARLLALTTIGGFQPSAHADVLACPPPTSQMESDIKADLSGQAQTFLKLGGAELKGKVETAVQNLYAKYPSADRIVIIRDMMYTTCQLLNNSHNLDDEAKFQKWFEFMGIARTFLPMGVRFEGTQPNFQSTRRKRNEYSDEIIESNVKDFNWFKLSLGATWLELTKPGFLPYLPLDYKLEILAE
jgi:hypothetical protein